ncbi:MAG: hypothetical protein ABI794_16370 [Betaproteobacteria bacterium]
MLTELVPTRQISGEPPRRWFFSQNVDLIVWCHESGAPLAFQLCYDKATGERALTWKPGRGFAHMTVDDGEDSGAGHKRTPTLTPDRCFDANRVSELFARMCNGLPPGIIAFVADKIREHSSYGRDASAAGATESRAAP